MIDDGAELFDPAGQRYFLVGLEEEARIGQARPDDPLVAFDDVGRVGQGHVADDQETVRQLAGGGVEQREVFLVQPHRQDQAFLGHGKEFGFEFAHVDRGVLDQRAHLVQQRGHVGFVAQRRLQARGLVAQLALDGGAALLERGDHAARLVQQRFIGIGRGQLDRRLRLETMAARAAAGTQAERGDVDHRVAVQRDQAVRGAHEADGGDAVGRLIAHDLGNGQLAQRVFQRRLQGGRQRRALGDAAVDELFVLAVRLARESGDVDALQALGRELLLQRGRGLAVGVQPHAHGHEFFREFAVGSLRQHGRQVHGQPSRRGIGGGGAAVGQQAPALQAGGDAFGEGLSQAVERLGREFLGEQFQQEG